MTNEAMCEFWNTIEVDTIKFKIHPPSPEDVIQARLILEAERQRLINGPTKSTKSIACEDDKVKVDISDLPMLKKANLDYAVKVGFKNINDLTESYLTVNGHEIPLVESFSYIRNADSLDKIVATFLVASKNVSVSFGSE